jgi:hypothetical protein
LKREHGASFGGDETLDRVRRRIAVAERPPQCRARARARIGTPVGATSVDVSVWIAVVSGVALAAACGLRAFLPLWLLGLAGRAGWVEVVPSAAWISSDLALIALGVATVVELAADKIPVVDHALDAVGLVVRPAAAWFAAYALLVHWPAPWGQAAAFVLALIALAIQGVKAKVRLGSTAATFGAGNPLLSAIEDAMSFAISVAALLLPWVALAGILVVAWWLHRRSRTSRVVVEVPRS